MRLAIWWGEGYFDYEVPDGEEARYWDLIDSVRLGLTTEAPFLRFTDSAGDSTYIRSASIDVIEVTA